MPKTVYAVRGPRVRKGKAIKRSDPDSIYVEHEDSGYWYRKEDVFHSERAALVCAVERFGNYLLERLAGLCGEQQMFQELCSRLDELDGKRKGGD